jgi:hypothetical protein
VGLGELVAEFSVNAENFWEVARMRILSADLGDESMNPIDLLEELVVANEWAFDRSSEHEMVVETTGRWCDYRMFFIWREDLSALYFTCVFDTRVPEDKRPAITELICLANEKLWLGHFDVSSDDRLPMFRHTILTRGWQTLAPELLEDMVDIALAECERFYPALQFVVWAGHTPGDAIASAMMDTVGEA